MKQSDNELTKPLPEDLLQLDLEKILRERLPHKYSRFIPRSLYRRLEKIICQDELNRVLREAYPAQGCEFASRALELFGVRVRTYGLDRLPEGRFVFAANHPLGGLDGLALLSVLGKRYGADRVKFPVNDMLMNVTPLKGVFVPINKYGSQDRSGAEEMNAAYASEAQVAIFPAGLVSRLGDDGSIRDLEWKKGFAAKALEYDRQIIPVYIEALNRDRFYRVAKLRKSLGMKVNVEQIMLPAELTHACGMEIRIHFGQPEDTRLLKDALGTPRHIAQRIRDRVEGLRRTARALRQREAEESHEEE